MFYGSPQSRFKDDTQYIYIVDMSYVQIWSQIYGSTINTEDITFGIKLSKLSNKCWLLFSKTVDSE